MPNGALEEAQKSMQLVNMQVACAELLSRQRLSRLPVLVRYSHTVRVSYNVDDALRYDILHCFYFFGLASSFSQGSQ
jgi:hypothetical protein